MTEPQIKKFVKVNMTISLIILLLQIFCTFVILIDWQNDQKKLIKVNSELGSDDNIMLLRQPNIFQNSSVDLSDFGFGDIDAANGYRENESLTFMDP